jgi:transcriptional regulator with XRE-family HTH domain
LPPAARKPSPALVKARLQALGQAIRESRKEHGLTVERLAAESGVSARHVRNVQAGCNASLSTVVRLCLVLRLDLVIDAPGLLEQTARVISHLGLDLPRKGR